MLLSILYHLSLIMENVAGYDRESNINKTLTK